MLILPKKYEPNATSISGMEVLSSSETGRESEILAGSRSTGTKVSPVERTAVANTPIANA